MNDGNKGAVMMIGAAYKFNGLNEELVINK